MSKIDAVLITYPDIAHLGALPVAVGKLGIELLLSSLFIERNCYFIHSISNFKTFKKYPSKYNVTYIYSLYSTAH